MALSWIEQKDFSGGINSNYDHALIDRNELVEAEDVFVDSPGVAKRRGPFVELASSYADASNSEVVVGPTNPFQYASGHTAVIAAGKHDYNKFSQGVFTITSQPDEGFTKVSLWYFPFNKSYASGKGRFEAPILLFGPLTTEEAVKTGKISPAISRPKGTSQDKEEKDFTPSASNAKYNRSIISCSAFTVVVLVSTDNSVLTWTNGSQSHTRSFQRSNGTDTYYLRISCISLGDKVNNSVGSYGAGYDKLVVAKTMNSSQAQVGSVVEQLTPILKDREFTTCALVGGYHFLAGDPQFGQHFFWSKFEDSLGWTDDATDDDQAYFEHLPDDTASKVVGLSSLNSSLVVFKERSIFAIKIANNAPTEWVASQRAAIGTLDQRSIARWQDRLLFANRKGIYSFDGFDVRELSEKVRDLWEPVLSKWKNSWFITGSVYENYYIVTVMDESGTLQIALCLHIPSGAWTSLSGTRFTAATWGPDNRSLYGFFYPISTKSYKPAFCDLGQMFNSTQGNDSIGSGPTLAISLARITNNDRFRSKVWRRVEVSYEAVGTDGGLRVSYVKGTDSNPANFSWQTLADLPRSSDTKVRARKGLRSRALGIRLKEIKGSNGGALTSAKLTGVRVGFKSMRESRDEGN